MPKANPKVVARISAGLAIANAGQEVPAQITEDLQYWGTSPAYAVVSLWHNNIETYEQERMFVKDANRFANQIRQQGVDAIVKAHAGRNPWINQVIAAAA